MFTFSSFMWCWFSSCFTMTKISSLLDFGTNAKLLVTITTGVIVGSDEEEAVVQSSFIWSHNYSFGDGDQIVEMRRRRRETFSEAGKPGTFWSAVWTPQAPKVAEYWQMAACAILEWGTWGCCLSISNTNTISEISGRELVIHKSDFKKVNRSDRKDKSVRMSDEQVREGEGERKHKSRHSRSRSRHRCSHQVSLQLLLLFQFPFATSFPFLLLLSCLFFLLLIHLSILVWLHISLILLIQLSLVLLLHIFLLIYFNLFPLLLFHIALLPLLHFPCYCWCLFYCSPAPYFSPVPAKSFHTTAQFLLTTSLLYFTTSPG